VEKYHEPQQDAEALADAMGSLVEMIGSHSHQIARAIDWLKELRGERKLNTKN
jgi:uncharacterized protein Smg (DUF494 family)